MLDKLVRGLKLFGITDKERGRGSVHVRGGGVEGGRRGPMFVVSIIIVVTRQVPQ